MSKTAFATDNALTKKHWEEKLFREAVKESFFSKFMGEGRTSIVQTKTQVEKDQGDKITFGIRKKLVGAGVKSGTVLEGNEEALVTFSDSVTLEEYAHATRDRGPLDRKRAMFSIDEESKMALEEWISEKVDSIAFNAILSSPTKVFYPNTSGVMAATTSVATAAGLIDDSSYITLNHLSALRAWAKDGGGRQYEPIRPVKDKGQDVYVLLVSSAVAYDLKVDTNYQQAQREAMERGKSNPLFTGAIGIWDNVAVYEHENITNVDASQDYAQCVFLGASSLVWAWGKRPSIIAEEFDYRREHGYGTSLICAAKKPKFDSKDYGSLGVVFATRNISAL